MELTDEISINAGRAAVYAALNDPAVLKACIPGCDTLERVSATELDIHVGLRIALIKVGFSGVIVLDPAGAPARYSLLARGKGGVAGHAAGGAEVVLDERGGGTVLRYVIRADVGGKIAQYGSALIMGTARKLSAQFFERFKKIVEGRPNG